MLDEGDSAALLQDTFENHFRDMLLNVTHLKLGLGTETRYQYGTGTYVTGMY